MEISEETKTRFKEVFGFEPSTEVEVMFIDIRLITAKLGELAEVHRSFREEVDKFSGKYGGDSSLEVNYPADEMLKDRNRLLGLVKEERAACERFGEAYNVAKDSGYALPAPVISSFYPREPKKEKDG